MIAFLKGRFAVKTPAYVVIDVNGVGYGVQISLTTYSAIAEKETGLLHTYFRPSAVARFTVRGWPGTGTT